MKCSLYLNHIEDTRRAFETYIDKHIEEITLANLPRKSSDNSEGDSKSFNPLLTPNYSSQDHIFIESLKNDLDIPREII